MAGHSKWANIKHKKGKMDSQRGRLFTKLSRYITVAAKEGGADIEYNAALKTAVENAKMENMPNDNIDRAIKRGAGLLDEGNYEEVQYEGYGPSGVALLVESLTDNRNRTASDVRHAFEKFGGNLGTTGCVSWMFSRRGLILIDKTKDINMDDLEMQAIELGVEDIVVEDNIIEILTDVESFSGVRDKLQELGYKLSKANLIYDPQNTVDLEDKEDIDSLLNMIELLEESDDVQEVYHNWEIPDDLEI